MLTKFNHFYYSYQFAFNDGDIESLVKWKSLVVMEGESEGDEEKEHKPLVKEMHEGVRVRVFKGWEGKMLEL